MKALVFYLPFFLLLAQPAQAPAAAMVQTESHSSIQRENPSRVRHFPMAKKDRQQGKRFFNYPGLLGLAAVVIGIPLIMADGIGFIISLVGAGVCLIALILGGIFKWRGNIYATIGVALFALFFLVLAIIFSSY